MLAPVLGVSYGLTDEHGVGVAEFGAGIGGVFPWIEGYLPVNPGDDRVFGFGVRSGIPLGGSIEHQLYARIDLQQRDSITTFLNPTVFHHRDDRGQWFTALSGVYGMRQDEGASSITLFVAPTVGWTRRPHAGNPDERSAFGAFVVLSASFAFHTRQTE